MPDAQVSARSAGASPFFSPGQALPDDPEITLQKKSRSELVRQAMSNLSADHREILDLVYYQEKSIEDCALILGIPAATVKTRMFYARKKLAELVVGS